MSKLARALVYVALVLAGSTAVAAQEAGPTGVPVPRDTPTMDANTTRLFFGPTARSLPRGQVYLGVYEFFMPFVQVGVTDRLSIGGGTPLMFGIEDFERPFWITPKLQVLDTGRTQVAAGVFHAFDADSSGGGIAYGVVTRGDQNASFTGGVGMAYSVDGGRAAVVMIGGDARVRRNVKVMTENYIWQGGEGVMTGGFRFLGDHLSADVGLAIPVGAGDFFAFPVVNFVYVF
jgi:hypothetical protein